MNNNNINVKVSPTSTITINCSKPHIEWISVKDKLPKDFSIPDTEGIAKMCEYDYVFLYSDKVFPGYLIAIGHYRDDHWEIIDNIGAHSCTGKYVLKSEDITHWRPFDYPKDEE